jgi:hypothetical protein
MFNVATRVSKYIKNGGWIGMTLGAGASVMKVQDVCAAAKPGRVRRRNIWSQWRLLVGGIASGMLATGGATSVCTAIGVATAGSGLIVCGIVVVGAGSLMAGSLSSKAGETSGDMLCRAQ